MGGNSFGKQLTITTYGESHGESIGAILDGVPAGIELDISEIQKYVDRRRPGSSDVVTPRKEADTVLIQSGMFEGRTTGAPIGILIHNTDKRSGDYDNIKDKFRPGHADMTYQMKYGIRDYRGGGRSSGRETALRVAGGAIARKILPANTKIVGSLINIGGVSSSKWDESVIYSNPFFSADLDVANNWKVMISKAIEEGTSLGAIVEVRVYNPPIGLGEPVYDKLSADLAKGLFSIGAVKGLEIGDGFGSVGLMGHQHNDEMFVDNDGKVKFKSNHSGGILGGISNGDTIILRLAIKPTSSISRGQNTVDVSGNDKIMELKGRHDPCVGIRVAPVAEAMVALTLADHYLRLTPPRNS